MEQLTPPLWEWVIVNTPEFCDSGLQIAMYQGNKWIIDTGEDITQYVKGWRAAPAFDNN